MGATRSARRCDWRSRTVEAGDAKAVAIATLALIVFGILEFWPRHLPSWLPRWLFQTNPDSDASMGSRAR